MGEHEKKKELIKATSPTFGETRWFPRYGARKIIGGRVGVLRGKEEQNETSLETYWTRQKRGT